MEIISTYHCDIMLSSTANLGTIMIEPEQAHVGDLFDIKLAYIAGDPVPAGSTIFFEWGGGWLLTPYMSDPAAPGYTTATGPNNEVIEAELTDYYYSEKLNGVGRAIAVHLQNIGLANGDQITVIINQPHVPFRYRMSTTPFAGDFQFFGRVKTGEESIYIGNTAVLKVIAGPPVSLKAVVPGIGTLGKAVPLLIQVLDNWNNIADTYTGTVRIPTTERPTIIRFTSDSAGSITANIRFQKEGIHYVVIEDKERNWRAESNPIWIKSGKIDRHIFFGDLHAHSNPVLSSPENLNQFYEYARNVAALDFAALMRFAKETDEEKWEEIKQINRKHSQSGQFIAFLGFEWQRDFSACTNDKCSCEELRHQRAGDLNVYFPADDGPLFKASEPNACTPHRLLRALKGTSAIAVPHHPSAPRTPQDASMEYKYVNWEIIPKSDDFVPLVEIYSKWGSSEYEGNPRPIANCSKGHFVKDALRMGFKLGFIASSDSQIGLPGGNVKEGSGFIRYGRGGFACVYAEGKTKEAIHNGLKSRHCYATTGVRIIVDFDLNGTCMGSEFEIEPDEPRRIRALVAGTSIIESVTIVRNGDNLHTHIGKDKIEEFEFVDNQDIREILMTADGVRPFVYYYLRIIQDDWELGWSSPIWIRLR